MKSLNSLLLLLEVPMGRVGSGLHVIRPNPNHKSHALFLNRTPIWPKIENAGQFSSSWVELFRQPYLILRHRILCMYSCPIERMHLPFFLADPDESGFSDPSTGECAPHQNPKIFTPPRHRPMASRVALSLPTESPPHAAFRCCRLAR